ncbi:TetR family transcriptional regulator [Flavihumibacter rivuli]|uniref:TetR family transcriptional regulator n=1 Tax=Flavihumibacter rivuli TaxID=2838156 RepID=UPI001BDE3706|nr:TetR family transcriptional regulator [Flavihumibacter rivuli]ULQ55373.1 TetR family transcriptional regulator [Flavihumibacter rivuli]
MEGKIEKVEKRDQILEAAEQLFFNKGFEGTSVREVCQLANVNVAMVNYYFGSKEGLFEKMIERRASFLKGKLQQLMDDQSLSAAEKINRIIDSYVERLFSHRGFTLTIMREMTVQQRSHFHETMANIFIGNMRIIKHIVQKGIDDGEFRKVDIEMTLSSLIGTIYQVLINDCMVIKMTDAPADFKPYEDDSFMERVKLHLKDMMHAHLQNKN